MGTLLGGIQTALAATRTGIAISKIKSTKFAKGGSTAIGEAANVMFKGGAYYYQNGRLNNRGSFANGGAVASPSIGVIGEAGPEYVSPSWMVTTQNTRIYSTIWSPSAR